MVAPSISWPATTAFDGRIESPFIEIQLRPFKRRADTDREREKERKKKPNTMNKHRDRTKSYFDRINIK